MQPMPPCPAPTCWWQIQVSGLLLHWQLRLGVYSVGFFFLLPVMLPSEIPKLPTDPPVREFLTVWKFLLHATSPGWVSIIPNSFASLSFINSSTSFGREWAAFLGAWCPLPAFRSCFVEVTQHSNDLWMNL